MISDAKEFETQYYNRLTPKIEENMGSNFYCKMPIFIETRAHAWQLILLANNPFYQSLVQ